MRKTRLELSGSARQLYDQVEKIRREHMENKGQSKNSKFSYRDKMSPFVQFVAAEFNLQQLKNLSDKHLLAYLEYAEEQGRSASTIKNTLSAVRWFHSRLPKTRYHLSDNEKLAEMRGQALPKRQMRGTGKNRAWSDMEYDNALALDPQSGAQRSFLIAQKSQFALRFGRLFGLRVHEITKMERSHVKQALENGYLTVIGKGGLPRDVPVDSKEAHALLVEVLKTMPSTREKLFVEKLGYTHKSIKQIEGWIYRNQLHYREKEGSLTIHGLRHKYAQEHYEELLRKNGGDEKAARLATAELLGHGRDWVTKIYLES